MSLTQDQITHLQKLTALMGQDNLEISSVVDSFSTLEQADIQGVNAVHRSGNGSLMPRPDLIQSDPTLPDMLLACSEQKVAAHQVVLGGIMIGE